jgi:IS1 family transposase
MIPKLSRPCYPIESMIHNSNINTLKPICYAHFQSIIKYRIVFWGNSSNSGKIFILQKIIRIMAGAQPRASHTSLLHQSKILPVPTLYILSFMNFIINNQGNFQTNSSIHNSNNTRNKHHLHRPNAKLSCFKKSTLYAGINICNISLASLTLLTNTTVSDWVAAVQCHWLRTLSKLPRHTGKSSVTLWCKILEIWTLCKYLPITLCTHILWLVNIIFQSSGHHFLTTGHSYNIPCRKGEAPFDTDDTEFIAIIFCPWNTDFDAAQW